VSDPPPKPGPDSVDVSPVDVSPVDVSAVIVNYESADLAAGCARSLLAQEFEGPEGAAGTLEVLVVDNASSAADRERLGALPDGVRRIDSPENLGYAGAANLGFEHAKGRYLCLLNPDIVVLPGAIGAMAGYLARHDDVGLVGPRTWMDDGRCIQHPINRLPSLRRLARAAVATRSPRAVGRASLERTRFATRYWKTREPLDLEMISGACMMVPRAVLGRAGGFDPGFPLYYEDADWCRRIGRAGYRLVYLPHAEIVHYHNMSAGKVPEEAARKREASRQRYHRRAFGPLGGRLAERCEARVRRKTAEAGVRPPWSFVQLGALERPPTLSLPDPSVEYVAEFAGTPIFDYPAGAIVRGAAFEFPSQTWALMPPSEVFVRLVDTRTFEVGPTWRFRRAEAVPAKAGDERS